MNKKADIVVIGAGIIGLAAAFQIARRSSLRVLVLDKGAGPAEGSTGASSAVCRYRYSYSEMVQLAKDGIGIYQRWAEFLENSSPMARFHRIGALWLSRDPVWAAQEAARLAGLGIRADTLDDRALAELFPGIDGCVVAPDLVTGQPHDCRGGGQHLLERDAGYMEPVDALQDLIRAARNRGVDVRFGTPVEDVVVRSGRVVAVRLMGGATVECGAAILATGPWCTTLLKRHGLDRWPLEPTRIQIVQIDRPHGVAGQLPVCVDRPGGIYFRPQNRGQQLIVGSLLEEDERETVDDPDGFATYADDEFIRPKLHALGHRLNLPDLRGQIRGYSGLYTINRTDMHPIVGQTCISGFYVANGCSGHGFKLAPGIGALLAREITGISSSFDTAMSPAFLAYDRDAIQLEALNVLA